jgi:hypothetical protein
MKPQFILLVTMLLSVSLWAEDSTSTTVSVLNEKVIGNIPNDFIGLSYEKSAVTENHSDPIILF